MIEVGILTKFFLEQFIGFIEIPPFYLGSTRFQNLVYPLER